MEHLGELFYLLDQCFCWNLERLRKASNVAARCVCVCVQPWTKGLPPPLFPLYMGRGPAADKQTLANKAMLVGGCTV